MTQAPGNVHHAGQFLTAIKDGLKKFLSTLAIYWAARKSSRAAMPWERFILNGMKKCIRSRHGLERCHVHLDSPLLPDNCFLIFFLILFSSWSHA